ncbi:hypothetical protein ACSQ5K_12820 [Pseudomonas sp. PhalM4]
MTFMDLVRWAISVGGKIFRVVPTASILIVLLTLVSQVSALLAALLPLKVIILLGSDKIPVYFPDQLHLFDRSSLILGLCTAAVIFFIFHLILEKVISSLAAQGAHILIARSRKLTLFDNQERTLSKAYQRFAGALAGGVFIVMASAALVTIYPLQAAVIAAYVISIWLIIKFTNKISTSLSKHPEESLFKLISILGSTGFFIVFGAIVADILLGSEVSVFWAIFTLLLARQVLRRLASFVTDLMSLYGQRLQLNALLFQGHVYTGSSGTLASVSLWSIADTLSLNSWMPPLLCRVTELNEIKLKTEILQSGMTDIIQWRVTIKETDQSYLVKLFGKSRAALARHEASLFTVMNEGAAPLIKLCLVDNVSEFQCHIFTWPAYNQVDPALAKRALLQITTGLMATMPHRSLVDKYNRSKPMLWQRIDMETATRLELFSCHHKDLIKQWKDSWPELRERLKALPLTLMIPDVSPDAMGYDDSGRIMGCQWGRWSLEPVGAGWPVSEKMFGLLESAITDACTKRHDLHNISLADIQLAALTFALDKACQRQNYRSSVELIYRIIDIMTTTRTQKSALAI